MRKWCHAIADLADCRLVKHVKPAHPDYKKYMTEGPLRIPKPTWDMVDRLQAARLIEWAKRSPMEYVALLTEAGRAEAAHEVRVPKTPLTCWPFPVSAHTEGVTP
jgi:predicted transcriptional regulator